MSTAWKYSRVSLFVFLLHLEKRPVRIWRVRSFRLPRRHSPVLSFAKCEGILVD